MIVNRPTVSYRSAGVNGKGYTPLWRETADPEKLTGAKLKGWKRAMAVAEGILNGKIADPTGGATFFKASRIYERGKPHTTSGFFRTSLESGRLVDSAYVSSSKRKTRNHFFVEVPAPRPPARRAGRNKR